MKEIFQFFSSINDRLHEKPIEGAGIGAGGWALYHIKNLLMLQPVNFHDWLFSIIADATGILSLIIVMITVFFSVRKLINPKLWDSK